MFSFSSNLFSTHNPIAHAELAHLNRGESSRRSSIRRISRAVYALALFVSTALTVFIFGLTIFSPEVFVTIDQQPFIWIREVLYVLIAFSLVTHFGLISRTLSAASETVLREKRGNTWESLLLTGIDTRRLILGKWWAVVTTTWRSFALLGVLRVGVVVGIGTLLMTNRRIQIFMLLDEPVAGASIKIVAVIVMVFALTMVNGIFTAAAGVLGSLLARQNTPGITTAWAMRLAMALMPVVILMPAVLYLSWFVQIGMRGASTSELVVALMLAQLSMIDNGVLALAGAAMPLDAYGGQYLLAALMPLVFYVVLTITLLRLAQFIARKQGVSEAA